ncbi:MAG: DUF5011 domain-containing protein, partial [Sulfurovum sp.]|nr:DUF5011 domain-containing protein [Sulfurovum sp.]
GASITDPLTPLIFDVHDDINGSGLDESSVKITFTDTNTSHMLVSDANSSTYRYLPSVTEPFALGTIAFTVYAKDQKGNEVNFAGSVVLIDVIPPVLTLNGEANVTLGQGEMYEELGATAVDDRDGNISVEISGSVDTSREGSYTLTYTATDNSGNSASVIRVVTVKNKVIGLTLTASQTHFIRKKEPYSDYYVRVKEPVKVMGIYSDGHSEEVTDNVKWGGERYGKVIKVESGHLIGGTHKKTRGQVTLTASIGNVRSNTLNIDVENEEDRLLDVKILNKNKREYKNRDALVFLNLMYKPTSDVKVRFKLTESDGVRFENGSLNTEITFSPTDTPFVDHHLKLVDHEVNNTNPYTVTTEAFESIDARYNAINPEDIVVETSKIKLLAPNILETKGAIRGVPIRFSVLSEHLHLKYTLVDPPKGMKIIEDYEALDNTGGTPCIAGVNVEWNVPMDIEEKIYTIVMKATDIEGNTKEVNFDIKVPTTKIISTLIVNNELMITDKNSSLYGMKMKGHSGEDISNLVLRSVAYSDVWKKELKEKQPEDVIERTVFILDNMPEALDVKMPEYMDTYKKRINIGMHSYRYTEKQYIRSIGRAVGEIWGRASKEAYLYENTNGYIFLHRYDEYKSHNSKLFLIVIEKLQNKGK